MVSDTNAKRKMWFVIMVMVRADRSELRFRETGGRGRYSEDGY